MSKRRGFLLFVLLASLAGFTPFVLQGWRDVKAFRSYREGTCTIVARGFFVTTRGTPKGSTTPAMQDRHPELTYRVHAADGIYFAYGFDNMNGRLSDMNEAERFRVGETHPCWYDPKNPEHAILVRQFRPKYYALAAIPAFMTFIVASMLAAELRTTKKKQRVEPRYGALKPDLTARSRIRVGVWILAVYTSIALGASYWLLQRETNFWFFILLLIAGEVGLIRRFLFFHRVRNVADPTAERDGSRVLVSIDLTSPLQKLVIARESEGERKTLFEKENVSGTVREWVSVSAADNAVVVTQQTAAGSVETEFGLN